MSIHESIKPNRITPEAKPSVVAILNHYRRQVENENRCFRVLREYLHILQDWKTRYAPESPDDELHPLFVEACHMLDCTQYMVDRLTLGSQAERSELVADMMKDGKIQLLQERLKMLKDDTHKPI
jgi:hypothetical protein